MFRREGLDPVLRGDDAAAAAAAVAGELRLTEAALRVNPKSYAAWHHRTWVVEVGKADLHAELQLAKTYGSLASGFGAQDSGFRCINTDGKICIY